MGKTWINITLGLCLSAVCSASWAEDNYYKYKDKDGHTVISNSLPPDAANQGYEVINALGHVIDTVAPRKTEQELNQEASEQKKREEAERQSQIQRQQMEEQAHKDEILLKSFSSENDIDRAKNDKLASIEILEEIVRENMTGLEKQLNDAKNAATHYQHAGQPIPTSLQHTLDESIRQIKENQAFLERKTAEKKEIQLKYQMLKDHFNALQSQKPAPHSSSDPITN